MIRTLRPLRLLGLLVLICLTVPSLFAQAFAHPPESDPASQRAALEAQREARGVDQFGTNCCQILQIPAAAFAPIDRSVFGELIQFDGNGYETMVNGSSGGIAWAPVSLPSGVALDYLDLYAYDADSMRNICVGLVTLTGTSTPSNAYIATTCSSGTTSYAYFSNFASGTINNDVVNGGAQYALYLYSTTSVMSTSLAFKAVDIWWHRQVSPAPGVATFNDVPTNHPFFQFVEALSASGITAGCQANPPLYCPDAPLTRKQMAAFLAKGFGLYWPY